MGKRYLDLGNDTQQRSRVLYRTMIFKTQELFTTLLAALTDHFTPLDIHIMFDHPETFTSLSGMSVEEATTRGMEFEWLNPVISTDGVVFGPPGSSNPSPDSTNPINSTSPTNSTTAASPTKSVFFSNHQTYLDWWLFWQLAYHYNHHGHLRIVLKDSLKGIPIFGWGMSFFEFIFLNRKWSVDEQRLNECLKTVVGIDASLPLWLLIFPEGTILDANTRSISKRYADKMELEFPFKHTIMPKSTGLLHILRKLTQSNSLYDPSKDFALYDITLAYPVRSSSKNQCTERITFPTLDYSLGSVFFQRQGPRKFHLVVRKCDWKSIDGLKSSESAFTEWLRDKFLEKDDMLAQYYDQVHKQMDQGTFVPRGSINSPKELFHGGFPKDLDIPTYKHGKRRSHARPTLGQTITVGPTITDSFILLTVTILMFRAWFYLLHVLGITWTWTGLLALILTLLAIVTGGLIYTNVLKIK